MANHNTETAPRNEESGDDGEFGDESTQDEVLHEIRNARIDSLEEEVERKAEEIENLRETIESLKEKGNNGAKIQKGVVGPSRVDGTPNRDGDIQQRLDQPTPPAEAFEDLDDDEATLHQLIVEGPRALTVNHNPVYPVHERARHVLLHAPSIGVVEKNGDSMHIRISLPDAKIHIEGKEDSNIKHTQMRRVFSKLEDAGSAYPRPPIVHKNSSGHIELMLFDYDALFETR